MGGGGKFILIQFFVYKFKKNLSWAKKGLPLPPMLRACYFDICLITEVAFYLSKYIAKLIRSIYFVDGDR